MPEDAAEAAVAAPPRLADTSITRQVTFWAFAALVVLAVAFYVWWGVSFGVWLDNGVYAVTITLLLFGLAGMWLMLPNPPTPVAPPR
jgi:type VI protein secretion system component VasF